MFLMQFLLVCSTLWQLMIMAPATIMPEPAVSAASAIVVCADSGDVLFEKNADEERSIASITKIMTAVVALEAADRQDKVIVFEKSMAAEGSSLYLQPGESLPLTELVKGMLCVSGNDAANAVAIGIAGSKERFAGLMNAKARTLGMTHTHFVNPSGLEEEGHYSSARDMAILCRYAMENESFAAIVSQKKLTVHYANPSGKTRECVNHNRLLSTAEGCIGIKTGYTKTAGRTLTSCAQRSGIRMIVVTLDDSDDWNDHQQLLDYGFSRVEKRVLTDSSYRLSVPLTGGTKDTVTVRPTGECSCTAVKDKALQLQQAVYLPHFLYAPTACGTVVGKLCWSKDGIIIASVPLCVAESVDSQS